MRRTLVLLAGGLLASASADKPNATPEGAKIATLTNKLDATVGGLDGILASQSKGSDGPTKFAQILKPYLTSLHSVLNEVKHDSKLTDAQKLKKLQDAEASVKGLTKDMSSRSTELKAEDETEKESLLMGVLMSRMGQPEKQLEVMQSPEFKNLEAVKYVLAHRDAKKDLGEQVASFLDGKNGKNAKAPKEAVKIAKVAQNSTKSKVAQNSTKSKDSKPATPSLADITGQIVGQLEVQLKKMEDHAAEQEKLHKTVEHEHKDMEKKFEDEAQKVGHLKGGAQKKKAAMRALKTVKRMAKKEEAEYKKNHGIVTRDIDSLKSAIESVKKGDLKALQVAQNALAHSLESMKASTGDFLHFLQLSEWTETTSKDCPYCKAQCLEKCHADGHTFMECMGSCANAGN